MGLVLQDSCSCGRFGTSLLYYRLEEKEYITRADEEIVPECVGLLSFSPSCCLRSGLQHFSPRLSELPCQTKFTNDENILSYKKTSLPPRRPRLGWTEVRRCRLWFPSHSLVVVRDLASQREAAQGPKAHRVVSHDGLCPPYTQARRRQKAESLFTLL